MVDPILIHNAYLMHLRVSVSKPHLCKQPLIFRVVRSPDGVRLTRLLKKLDCNGHQVSVTFHVEQSKRLGNIAFLAVNVIAWYSFKDLVICQVHVTRLVGRKRIVREWQNVASVFFCQSYLGSVESNGEHRFFSL